MMMGWHGWGKCHDDKKSIIGPTCQLAVRLWSHLHLIPTNKNLPCSELSSEKDIMFVLFWQTIWLHHSAYLYLNQQILCSLYIVNIDFNGVIWVKVQYFWRFSRTFVTCSPLFYGQSFGIRNEQLLIKEGSWEFKRCKNLDWSEFERSCAENLAWADIDGIAI